jgi:quercetin dioxygenase-like cupin family protein
MTDWIQDPVLKLRMRLQHEGNQLVGEVEIEPGGGIGKHYHPNQEETWTVFEGDMRFRVGRRKLTPAAGDKLTIPDGVRHSLKNVGPTTARLQFTASPALELAPFLTQATAMNRAGNVTRAGLPTSLRALLEGAEFIDRYRDTCVLVFPPPFPPPALQPVVFAPLAQLARRRRDAT